MALRTNGSSYRQLSALLLGFIEVRGLNVLDARALHGADAVVPEVALDLVIGLDPRIEPSAEERFGGRRASFRLLDRRAPEIPLPRHVGHNLASLVEAACRDHKLRLAAYRADEVLAQRRLEWLKHRDESLRFPRH